MVGLRLGLGLGSLEESSHVPRSATPSRSRWFRSLRVMRLIDVGRFAKYIST